VAVSRLKSLSSLAAATLTVLCAAGLAELAVGQARDFTASLNLDQPLIRSPGQVAPPPPRMARRVVVLLVDGLRLDSSRAMASVDALRRAGVDAPATSHYPTISRPNYVAIFAGVPPRLSGARTNDYPGPVTMDSAFSRAREGGLRTRYVTDFASGAGRLFAPALDEAASVRFWPGMFERAIDNALADEDPFLVIHFAAVDVAGHEHGADSDEYREAVAGTDALIGRIAARIDLARDALVLVSDHGHVDRGGHGGLEEETLAVPLVLAGAGVASGAAVREARLVDVAPTLCALLGLPAPGHSIGRTLVAALRLEPAVAAGLTRIDAARERSLERAADAVAVRMHVRAWLHRGLRAAGTVLVLAILLLGVRRLARRGVVRLDRRVLLLAVPAFPIIFYGLLAAFEPFMSPSMMPEEGDVTSLLLRYGAFAAGGNVLIIWLAVAWRAEAQVRLAAATGVVLVGLLVALVPAGVAWIAVSPPYAATVPGPLLMMLPPVTFAGVACYAVSAAVALVAEWALFAARASA
jgi:hypothetical protein